MERAPCTGPSRSRGRRTGSRSSPGSAAAHGGRGLMLVASTQHPRMDQRTAPPGRKAPSCPSSTWLAPTWSTTSAFRTATAPPRPTREHGADCDESAPPPRDGGGAAGEQPRSAAAAAYYTRSSGTSAAGGGGTGGGGGQPSLTAGDGGGCVRVSGSASSGSLKGGDDGGGGGTSGGGGGGGGGGRAFEGPGLERGYRCGAEAQEQCMSVWMDAWMDS